MLPYLSPTTIIAILIAVAVHEWAHGFAAYRLGDPTAKDLGRLTLNPVAHLDPIGTLLFLFVGFGWGKPVPVDPRYFRNYRRDGAITAFAGPLSNLILAFGSFALAKVIGIAPEVLGASGVLLAPDNQPLILNFMSELLGDMVLINLVLMAFNLLPVAPLDGSKVVQLWVPVRYDDMYEDYLQKGPWILLALIVAGHAFHLPILSWWISIILTPMLSLMHSLL
ncbi:site-2 protease family protein [Candidatus Peregrinibacteria bacterium]|nr:site-2 protease family protein [Candidatus Peregrinibacteria bacterium]